MTKDTLLLIWAQIILAGLTLIAFVTIIIAMLYTDIKITEKEMTVATSLLSVLGTIFTLQMNYFFARHRPDNSIDTSPSTAPAPPAAPQSGVSLK